MTTFSSIASSRNACYVYRTDVDGYVFGAATNLVTMEADFAAAVALYPEAVAGCWRVEFDREYPIYSYTVYQKPAFMMQLLAFAMSGTALDQASFAAMNVAPYLESSKWEVIWAKNMIKHPHYVESYYLLAQNLILNEE